MALTDDQVVALEAVLEEVEFHLDRCERGLLKGDEAAAGYTSLWHRAMAAATQDSDEWRYLDRTGRTHAAWWKATGTGYVDPGDSGNFAVLRDALKKLLNDAEPEFLRDQKRPKKQRFFNVGEEYPARSAIFTAMKRAKASLAVVDEYLDEEVFPFLESLDPHVELRLLTGNQKPIFRTLFVPFATKRGRAEAKFCGECHDRFLVLDETAAVHLGASINRAGKKAFMLNEVSDPMELDRFLAAYGNWWARGQPIT